MKKPFVVLLVVTLLLATLVVAGGWNKKGFCGIDFTEEQKTALADKMQELKDSDATYEEMKAAKMQIMEELGIDMTACNKGKEGFHRKKAFTKEYHKGKLGWLRTWGHAKKEGFGCNK